jgi:membrane-associated protease RseP (regulator of RpoE activity)
VATFLNGDYSRVAPIVSSFYKIVDMQRHPREDAVRFLISESSIHETFPKLVKELEKIGMIATAKRAKYESRLMPTLSSSTLSVENAVVVTVSKLMRTRPRNKYLIYLPALLFAATLMVVFADGIFRADSEFARAFIRDPVLLAAVYTMSLIGILGVHEMGHLIASRWHGIKTSWPYFIPFIPGIGFIPTLGALIVTRANMTNRNVLFDVGISGPIAGLIVTMIVSVYGSYTSVLLTAEEAQDLIEDARLVPFQWGSSLLMMAGHYIAGNGEANGDDAVLVMSPVLFAAWVGFLITFLNLMPAAQLDGGHVVRSTLGVRWHRILTYSSVGVLVGLQFYVMAFFVLLIAARAPESTPLDDVSPLSKKRKALFWVAMALAVLCAPIPNQPFMPLF